MKTIGRYFFIFLMRRGERCFRRGRWSLFIIQFVTNQLHKYDEYIYYIYMNEGMSDDVMMNVSLKSRWIPTFMPWFFTMIQ